MQPSHELWEFLPRLLGWTNGRAIDHALRSIELAVSHRAALVFSGEGDLVPIAHALHRRTLGAERPFIVCDPRRGDTPGSVRSAANFRSGVAAFEAATEGSLCLRSLRLPRDFSSLVALVREPGASVTVIVCSNGRLACRALLAIPVPIHVPSLKDRASELPRIVDEYARDAVAALCVRPMVFTDTDRQWILDHASTSLLEIERATLRLVALKISPNWSHAAERLGMAPVSLSRWIGRRPLPSMFPAT
jgi:hypothetical protein